jgi:chromosome segregation ATPase
MVVLVGGLVAAGWFIANQQQALIAEQARLTDANTRLQRLEQRLSATDTALSQGGEDTQEQLSLWESEIRKLWAVANERNKDWIKDNQKAVTGLDKSVTGLQSTARDLKAATARHEEAFSQQTALIDQLTSVDIQLQQLVRAQQDLVDKVNTTSQSVAKLRANLDTQVEENTEAIAAIDAYRIATNSRFRDLEQRLEELRRALSPAAAVN